MWLGLLMVSCGGSSAREPAFPPGSNLNARRYENLQTMASADMSCPAASLTYAQREHGFHTMAGCGQARDYFLYCQGMACTWMVPPYQDAAFALNCDASALQLVMLPNNKAGIVGCGHRSIYLAHCSAGGWGSNCTWLLEGSATTTAVASEPPPPPPPPPVQ